MINEKAVYCIKPVLLALPTGMTFGVGAVALVTPVASTMGRRPDRGRCMTLADRITYDVAAKAASGGVRAFVEATELIVDALTQSMSKFIEIELLWGSSAHGTLGESTVHTGSGTTGVITIDLAEWSAGIWSGMENINIDAYNAGVLVNTNAPLVVSSVNVSTRVVTVTGNSTDITAINTANGTALQLFPYLAFGQEMQGVFSTS